MTKLEIQKLLEWRKRMWGIMFEGIKYPVTDYDPELGILVSKKDKERLEKERGNNG